LQTPLELFMAILRKEDISMILCQACVGIIDNYICCDWCRKSSS